MIAKLLITKRFTYMLVMYIEQLELRKKTTKVNDLLYLITLIDTNVINTKSKN